MVQPTKFSAVLAAALVGAVVATSPRSVGNFKVANAAFIELGSLSGQGPVDAPLDLFLSTFTGNPFAKQYVSMVKDFGSYWPNNLANVELTTLTTSLKWPNTKELLPSNSFTSPAATDNWFLQAYGFLVPPNNVGGVSAVNVGSTVEVTKISEDKGNVLDGWFYHMTLMVDMDGDGIKDVLTARATKPILGAEAGEFLWYKQPSSDPFSASNLPWAQTSLMTGEYAPDVFFIMTDFGGVLDEEVIVYTSYFSGGGFHLLTSNATGPGRWNVDNIVHTTIDLSIGLGFECQVEDVNGDGKLDVLVTNHVDDESVSGVFVYEIPPTGTSITDATAWRKHTIAKGFKVRVPGPGQAAPGQAKAVFPSTKKSGKPVVLVEGDGDERFYVLEPLGQSPLDWSYNMTEIYDCAGTVGSFTVGDINTDSYTDVLLACYSLNGGTVASFTFAP